MPTRVEERQEELLALFLLFTKRIEGRIEERLRPVLRGAMLELRSIIAQLSPTGQFRNYEWQQIQPLVLPILERITTVLRIQIPIELQIIRPQIQQAAAQYLEIPTPPLPEESNADLLRRITIGAATLYTILGAPGTRGRLTINMANDLDRLIRNGLLQDLPTTEILNKVVRTLERRGVITAQVRRGSYANQMLNRTTNTVTAAVWDVANTTARDLWSSQATPNTRWLWLATLENTCPVCLPYHKQTRRNLNDFPFLPKVHPNCHCVVLPVTNS